MTEAAMGRMESLQWGESSPTEQDVSHLVSFLLSAVKGDTARQIKGKVQKAVGKVQDKLGKKS